MNKLFFVTGASGSGKTTLVENLERKYPKQYTTLIFDSIGVPSLDEMVANYGSPEGWQKAMTDAWISKITERYLSDKTVVLDGQIRLSFLVDACTRMKFSDYEIILVDCNDRERSQRLISRGHPELANDGMMNWASYLRNEANVLRASVIDNSDLSEEKTLELFVESLNKAGRQMPHSS